MKNSNLSLKYKVFIGLLWMSFFVICLPVNLYAQKVYSIETVPNVRLNDKQNHVSNPDQILSIVYVDSINHVLNELEDSVGVEVAVVALNSVGENDVRMFASDLFNRWGIGKKGKDNGLLVLLVTQPEQRAVIFETGYGIEGILPDATCFSIQQKFMLPEMKEGNYDTGMLNGIRAAVRYLYEDEQTELWFSLILIASIFLLWLLFYILPQLLFRRMVNFFKTLFKKMKSDICPECGKKTLKYQGDEIVKQSTATAKGSGYEVYVCKSCGYTKKEKFTLSKREIPGLGVDDSDMNRRRRPTRSSHSSRSGRSGGSWGGGSSGGGGSISRF